MISRPSWTKDKSVWAPGRVAKLVWFTEENGWAKADDLRRDVMVRRLFIAMILATSMILGGTSLSVAEDGDTSAFRDIAVGKDYRLRVAAALALSRSKSPGARPALEKALKDAHPAVRASAAAALGALGNPAAVPALKAALDTEAAPPLKRQIQAAIEKLSKSSARARFLVSLGKFENRSGVKDAMLGSMLRQHTRSRVSQFVDIEIVADGTDVAAEGKTRKLPAFTLDGSVTQLSKRQGADGVGYAAKVEYVIREMPSQTLKGSMTGSAQAVAEARRAKGRRELAQLQSDAVAGAIESALQRAPLALEAASGTSGLPAGR
ncbi:HEAT repeat domain-containing protein [Sorangium sp. So ce321]|uniref:HEAT repeat domain-containing protein n=1 Tax=Sorangium sp. So ce321 TaxID=3133300 RepID=UPI003F6091BF